MTAQVKITGLSRVKNPKPNQGGSVILAFFDCEVPGMELRGCALTRTRNGGLVAWPPNFIDQTERRAIRITDDSLRHAMMLHAREVYRAFGGTDADQIGKSVPMGPRQI